VCHLRPGKGQDDIAIVVFWRDDAGQDLFSYSHGFEIDGRESFQIALWHDALALGADI
jgi:hypothetical protein